MIFFELIIFSFYKKKRMKSASNSQPSIVDNSYIYHNQEQQPNANSMIKLLIADDHQVLIEGLIELLSGIDNISVVTTANNGKQVLDILKENEIDVILMDINMPIMNGLETCKAVKQKYPDIKVLALTTLDKGSFIQMMLKYGASGYLLKNTSQEELITAIESVHKGETFINEQTNKILMNSLMNQKTNHSFIPTLTRREKEVLDLIAKELTTGEISESLHISLNTVQTHRRNLIQKFNVKNSVGLVRKAMLRGLID